MVEFEDLVECYYRARKSKRRSPDSVSFEVDLERNLVGLWESLNDRTFRADSNFAFVVRSPKAREIFATSMRVRIVHHYIDMRLRPIYEKVISDRSFNNRKGMGLHAAIATFGNDVREMSENYTKDAWIFHLDLKGFFPNADVEIALAQQLKLVREHYSGSDAADLEFMLEACMRADPARHCSHRCEPESWSLIPPEKSLFNKPVGVGAAIGFLCWQNAMGVYINDVVKWIQSHEFLRVVVFVDDIYVVTRDKEAFLSMIPEIRERLAALNVRLNERKFYCQHFSKGVHVLGTRMKFDRRYLDRRSVRRAWENVIALGTMEDKWRHVDRILATVNTEISLLADKTMRKTLESFVGLCSGMFRDVLEFNETKGYFRAKKKFSFRRSLSRRYKVEI